MSVVERHLDDVVGGTFDATDRPTQSMGAGFRWVGGLRVGGQVIQIASTLALSRLIEPRELGLVALANIVIGFFHRVLGDTGTSAAIVRNRQITHGLLSSIFMLNMMIGAVTTVSLVWLGTPVARLLGDADAGPLLSVLGVVALIKAMTYTPLALMRRQLAFKKLSITTIVEVVVNSAVTVILAAFGAGAWSLVWGLVSGAAASLLLSWYYAGWRPSIHFAPSRLREISGFSGAITAQNFFAYGASVGDQAVVGRLLTTTALGYYGLAVRTIRYPVNTLAQTYREVVLPNLARLQHDDQAMLAAYRRTVAGLTFLLMPICFMIAALAEPIVTVLLGSRWEPAIDVIRIIAILGAVQSVSQTTGSVYLAKGRSDLSLLWTIGSSSILVGSYFVGAQWGIEGVALVYLIAVAALTYPALWLPLRLIGATPSAILRPTAGPFAASAAAGGASYLITTQIDSGVLQLLVGSLVGVGCYLTYATMAKPSGWVDLLGLLQRSSTSESTATS